MVERFFLGWDKPFVGLVADWLLERNDAPEETMVVVPTGQSARQLKYQMTRISDAVLSPKLTTPGALMRKEDANIAPDWLERLAWQEILEHQSTPSILEALFSKSAETSGEWAGGVASEMLTLRRNLQENGLMLHDIARRLSSTPEKERWDALAEAESKVETWLRKQGRQSRSTALRGGITLPNGIHHIILAGTSELPPLVARAICDSECTVTSLVAAPDTKAEFFCELGTPLESWLDEPLSWPSSDDSLQVTTDPKQQAQLARKIAAKEQTKADEIALGSADIEVGDQLAIEFSSAGWPTHHPATHTHEDSLRIWLHGWNQWMQQPDLASVMNLLTLPLTAKLIEADCAHIASSLAQLRDRWMVIRPDDIRHQLKHGDHNYLKVEAVDVIRACEKLEKWKKLCDSGKHNDSLRHLLDAMDIPADDSAGIRMWLEEAADQMGRSGRSLSYWIQLMLSDQTRPQATPPDGRVIDVHGWLELLFQPGTHLIICGLNEGKVPAAKSDDPWLGESARKLLKLHTESSRAARDTFLLQSMMQSRISSGGRVHLICSRSNDGGEPMLPSRLLLATEPNDIPARVNLLFRELEPADAKLRWEPEPEARWNAPTAEIPTNLNATSFRDYLACPFRYYLKHVHRMQASEPDRIEWNARDFGNIIHNVLEAWARDEVMRELNSADDIQHALNQQLDLQVQHIFNQSIPLAIRIQLDAIRQRLQWFAQSQEELIAEGWRIAEVEHKFEIPIGDSTVRAKIDRMDRHADTGELRIIDYKTGGASESAASVHRSRQIANSKLPAHIHEDDPAVYERNDGKKTNRYLWRDLQLPLYALAIHARDKQLATPCYFKIGETAKEVKLNPWQDFEDLDLEAARACAEWVSKCISEGKFSPIAEKPRYDDYALLWCNRTPEEVMQEQPD